MNFAICQITSGLDPKKNLAKIQSLLDNTDEKIEALFLSECFYSLSDGKSATPYLVEFGEACENFSRIKEFAIKNKVYLLGGSVASKVNDLILNRSLFISPKGELLSSYDKKHLFSCNINGKTISEANIYTKGSGELEVFKLGPYVFGANVCFDLRFPSQSSAYVQKGANVLLFPSAFTVPTGKAHWHTLLKARAIENQCFVIASAQHGKHNQHISTYGHSLVIDPWGNVLIDLEEGEKISAFKLNLELIEEIKNKVIMK